MSNLKFKEPLSWTVPADKMVIRGRLDAEHFQPKFDELLGRIASDGLAMPLAELASVIRRGKQPRYVNDGEILVINSRHVGVCPELCVFGVIDGSRWAGLVRGDRADEQGNDNDWCAAC